MNIYQNERAREDSDFPSPRMLHSGKRVFGKCTSRLYFRLSCLASIRKERFIARKAQAIVLGPGALSAATNAMAPCFKKVFRSICTCHVPGSFIQILSTTCSLIVREQGKDLSIPRVLRAYDCSICSDSPTF